MYKRTLMHMFILMLSILSLINGQMSEGDDCITLSNTKGKCTNFYKCSNVFKDGKRPPICGFQGRTPIVCCDAQSDYKTSIRYKKCQEYSSTIPQVFSSAGDKCGVRVHEYLENISEPGEFVHAAALGFELEDGEIKWVCGGSLISRRYVLTVAHCVNKRNLTRVRLGTTDMTSGVKDQNAFDYDVLRTIQHPDYTTRKIYNDIGLVQLKRLVTFTSYIRPICLPFKNDIPKTAIEASWGNPNTNSFVDRSFKFLVKGILKIIDNSTCNDLLYKDKGQQTLERGINDSQICADPKLNRTETILCVGRSGGSLLVYNTEAYCMFTQIGTNSFGKTGCRSREFPDVYTNIYYFVDWIESIVWENGNE